MSRFAFVLLTLSTGGLIAQSTSIQGLVTDSSGAAVADTEIVLQHLDTGTQRTFRTNDAGLYTAPSLNIGRYTVTAAKQGFRTARSDEFTLTTGQVARVDLVLQPGAVSETITVAGSAPALDTETTTVGQVINNTTIVNLPLNGRNYLELARLTTAAGPATGSRPGPEGAFAASGQHGWQVNIQVDGMDNSSRESGGALGYEVQAVKPSVDSVAEFRVVTSNLSAEHGFRMGGTVFVTLKSGTNQFHGSAFEFFRNSTMDATNFFANRNGAGKPTYKRNQFGGTLGGPIIKDRTFFFGSYEGTTIRAGQSFTSTVPTNDLKNGDFSRVRPIFDPATTTGTGGNMTRQPFPGNQIPRDRWDPLFPGLMALYPDAMNQSTFNNYFYSPVTKTRNDSYDFKGDHNFTDMSRLSLRYSYRRVDELQPGPLPLPADGGQWETTDLHSHNAVVTHSHTFTPTLTNEARFGVSRIRSVIDIPYDRPLFDDFGIKGIPKTNSAYSNDHGLTRFTPAGYAELGPTSAWPNFNNLMYYQFSDILFKSAGRHTFKFGGDFRQERMYRNAARYARGQMAFNREFTADPKNRANTGDGLAEFMLGWAAGGTLGNENGENIHNNSFDFFVQDDWKITNRLTLNLGFRYDVFLAATFPDGLVSNFLLDFNNTGPNARLQQVRPGNTGDCGCKQDLNNFAPRVGFAWQATPKTVIRSGFGLIYGQADSLRKHSTRFTNQAPDYVEYSFATLDRINPRLYLKDGFPAIQLPATEVPGPASVGITNRPEAFPTQYSSQWFFDVQQELPWGLVTTVGYQGNGTRKLAAGLNYNLPVDGPSPVPVAQRRRWPYYTGVSTLLADGTLNYNALTWRVEKRFSQGLQFLSAYTWSKNIDTVLEDNNEVGGQGALNPYNRKLERARSVNDINHVWTLSSVYELPFGKGRRWANTNRYANWFIGGWQLGAIVSMRSGAPFTVTTSGNITNSGGSDRPNRIGSGELPDSERSIDGWFDTSAFALQPQYTYGNSGRNILSGPGAKNLDLSLAKSFAIRERMNLQFRFESFNATNTPAFGQPNGTLNSLEVGTITTASDPRRMQLGLKLLW